MANSGVVIQLPGNPSTGYRWHLNPEDSSGLEWVEIEPLGYGEPESDLRGAPAPYLFQVTCTGTGEVQLQFDYISPSGQKVSKRATHEMTCE